MREVAWLIEVTGPRWWTGDSLSEYSFSDDPNRAVRFCRQEDAEAVRCHLFSGPIYNLSKTTEHIWMGKEPDGERG